jgi:DNA-binding CsgD family transcriptional regulator
LATQKKTDGTDLAEIRSRVEALEQKFGVIRPKETLIGKATGAVTESKPTYDERLHERAEAILAPVLKAQGRFAKSYSADEYLIAAEQAGNELATDEFEESFPTEEMRSEAALLGATSGAHPSPESVRTMLATKRHLRAMGFDAEPGKPIPDDVDQDALVAAGTKVEQERETAVSLLVDQGASDSTIADMLGISEREVLSIRTRLPRQ